MAIWKYNLTLEGIKSRNVNTMVDHVGIEFTEIGEDYLKARMPVDARTIQPLGIMHGGASCVLAETVGSIASNYCLDHNFHYSVGLDINTSHIKMARGGYVTATARPINLGKTIHVWEVKIVNDEGALVSITRLTLAVLNKRESIQKPGVTD